jgi:hypothetical protein
MSSLAGIYKSQFGPWAVVFVASLLAPSFKAGLLTNPPFLNIVEKSRSSSYF